MITLDALNRMFTAMRTEAGYKKWNVDGELLWGYYFTDPNPLKLKPVAEYLAKEGYRVVDTYQTDDKKTYVLHVEKVEHHTPESLNKKNIEFYKLAQRFGLESYDGMDVGPAQ